MTALDLPETVRRGDLEWSVARAWPATAGPMPVELRSSDGHERLVRGAWWSSGRLAVDDAGDDPALPSLTGLDGRIVSHRPGKRAVVRTPGGEAYLKVVRPKKAAAVVAASDRAAAFGTRFVVPTLERDPSEEARGVVRFTVVPGRTLHAVGADGAVMDAEWCAAWERWHDDWSALMGTDAGGAPIHDAAAEAAVVREWADHAARALPEAAATIRGQADEVAAELLQHPSSRLVLAHRDLHDKQLLWDGARLGLLDVDTVSAAEPELDLANLRAHVDLRVAQGHWSPPRADDARTWIDRTAADVRADPERLVAYGAATRLRLACLYLFRPRWRAWAERTLRAGT